MTTSPHADALGALTERVGDAERDALVAELTGHHLHGRLSADELDRRQDLALTAVTRYDLLLLVNDLPRAELPVARPAPEPSVVPALAQAGGVVARRTGKAALLASPVVGAAAVVGNITQYSAGFDTGFLSVVLGGAVGYGTHAVLGRWRAHRRTTG